MLPDKLVKQMMDDCLNKARENLEKRKYVYACDIRVPDELVCNWKEFDYLKQPWITYDNYIQPYAICKMEKENNKMEAKKCDRCGKLYEMPKYDERSGANVRFSFMPVYDADDLSEKRIAEKQSKNIVITLDSCREGGTTVDLCPECRKSLKMWFESGVNEK